MKFLAIIGGGPAGYKAAELAAKAGKEVVLFEQNALGGTCLNVGCIPTKTLLYSAKQYYNALHADKYGVRASEVSFDYSKMVLRKQKVVRKLVAGIRASLKDVEVVSAHAEVVSATPEKVVISANDTLYEAENLLLCTGSSNFVPPIPGIDSPCVMDSTIALDLKELPKSVAIIGGGVIGMEFATLYHELGVEVTVIEAMPTILPNIDPDIVAYLRIKYEKEGVRILTGKAVRSIDGNKCILDDDTIEAERILVCVGRRPVLPNLDFEMDGRVLRIDEHCRTSVPNVYAAGDVTGKIMLAHVASRQAEVAVRAMLGIEDAMRYDAVPSVVYTNPEIASIGLSAPQNQEPSTLNPSPLTLNPSPLTVHLLPMTYSGRFVAENEGETGLLKLVTCDDKIVGVHMIGNPCSEFIAVASMAITSGMTIEQFRRVIFPHPTVSEILKESL